MVTALAFGLFAVPVLAGGAIASAQTTNTSNPDISGNLCSGANLKFNDGTDCTTQGDASNLNTLIAKIVNIFSVIVGVAAVIMIIYGGFKYITSGGDSGNVSGAKNTILYAIIGLVIVALAQFVVKFVLTQSGNLTNGA
jgi:cytochrome bd-type quinol oxidase subunit 2